MMKEAPLPGVERTSSQPLWSSTTVLLMSSAGATGSFRELPFLEKLSMLEMIRAVRIPALWMLPAWLTMPRLSMYSRMTCMDSPKLSATRLLAGRSRVNALHQYD